MRTAGTPATLSTTSPMAPASAATAPPSAARPTHGPARPTLALALLLTVAFMVVLDFSIVNVALASIERQLHVSATGVQWVITAYAITFGGLLVLGGRIGDLCGRRRTFVLGLVVFSVASFVGGLAGSIEVLVAARAAQGIGAALVAPAALSLITTTIPEGPARTRALGMYGATASVGFVAGLVLGGVLVQAVDWRAVLWVNVPIGLAAAVLTRLWIPRAARETRRGPLDVGGAALVTAGVAVLVFAVSEGPEHGWLSLETLGAVVLSSLIVAGFVALERRHPGPLVRLELLRRRTLAAANVYFALLGAWSAGELLVVPLYLQLALHYSPIAAGLAMAPQGMVGFLGAASGPRLARRVGLQRVLLFSGIAATAGLGLLGIFLVARSYPLLLAGFGLAGYGTATGAFGATVGATQGVADNEQGLAGGLVNMSRQIGAAVGVAVAAAVIGTATTSGASIVSDRTSMLVTAGAALAGTLAAAASGRRAPDAGARRLAAIG